MKFSLPIYPLKFNYRIAIGLFCVFTMNKLPAGAMDKDSEQNDKNFYKKIISLAYEAGTAFNWSYLNTLKPSDEIDHQELFAPQSPEDTITAAALCVIAGDVEQLEKFLQKPSKRANFNYSQEKKEKLAEAHCAEDLQEEKRKLSAKIYEKYLRLEKEKLVAEIYPEYLQKEKMELTVERYVGDSPQGKNTSDLLEKKARSAAEKRAKNLLKEKAKLAVEKYVEDSPAAKETGVAELYAKDRARKKQFIQQHLYTKNHFNPNDPIFYLFCHRHIIGPRNYWFHPSSPNSSSSLSPYGWYSLAHLAVNPYILYQGWDSNDNGPAYLPHLKSVSQKARFRIIDILAALKADFNCLPHEYRRHLLPPVIASPSAHLLCAARFDYVPYSPSGVENYDGTWIFSGSTPFELMARAVLYGANIEKDYFLKDNNEVLNTDVNEFRENLLQRAFKQVLNEERLRFWMRPTQHVREKLQKKQEQHIQSITTELNDLTLEKWWEVEVERPIEEIEKELSDKKSKFLAELEHVQKLKIILQPDRD